MNVSSFDVFNEMENKYFLIVQNAGSIALVTDFKQFQWNNKYKLLFCPLKVKNPIRIKQLSNLF